jgi:hypothetical protein
MLPVLLPLTPTRFDSAQYRLRQRSRCLQACAEPAVCSVLTRQRRYEQRFFKTGVFASFSPARLDRSLSKSDTHLFTSFKMKKENVL